MCSDYSFFPCSPSPWTTLFPDATILKLGQLITFQWPVSVQEEGKPHISHFKLKLEIKIKIKK